MPVFENIFVSSSKMLTRRVPLGISCSKNLWSWRKAASLESRDLGGGPGVRPRSVNSYRQICLGPYLLERRTELCGRQMSTAGQGGGPVKVTTLNRRPRGIIPIGEDYGGYDEDKHEEYEKNAEQRQRRIRSLKKVISTGVFGSVLGAVLYARRRKQQTLEEYTKNAVFLPKDDLFVGSHNSFCVVTSGDGLEKVVLPAGIVRDGTMKFIQDMEFRRGDVVVASFPKTGTTWVQEIVYLVENKLDFAKAQSGVLEDRFPFLEYPYPGVKSIDKMASPRLIKTHLPYAFLPKNANEAKIIYVIRNPKDTLVSYYHFAKMLTFSEYIGTFNEFADRFKNDRLPYTPFFGHIESYLKRKGCENILILTYEELSKEPADAVQKIAEFLEKPLTHEEVKKIVDHTRFDEMACNPAVNYQHWDSLGIRKKGEANFLRKGKVGDWKNYLSSDENEIFTKWMEANNQSNFLFEFNP